MKKLCLLLPLLLLLCACAQAQTVTLAQLESQALNTYGADEYVLADGDFVSTNFPSALHVKQARVYLSKQGDGREFGIFELTDGRYAAQTVAAIRTYLENEEQAVRSLASLYPADDLNARLHRLQNVRIENKGNLVSYYLVDA